MKLQPESPVAGPSTLCLRRAVFCGTVALIVAASIAGCSENGSSAAEKKAGGGGPAVPVMAAPVVAKTVPLHIQGIGNVEPFATVAVKARVDGQIVKVFFTDGQEVKKGQPLFQLDPRPFEAALKQSAANLLRDKAQREHARAQERRYKDLLQKNFVSKDAYSQFLTNVETANATVRADEAAVENARLQLEYATIRAPISGRTGKIMIQLGNLVKANDTSPLVQINQIAPVYLSFAVPEQYLPEIRKYMAAGRIPVQAQLSNADTSAVDGELAFIDNAVDTATGTIRLRAIFQNEDRALWPGQFVTALVTLREQRDAIVVPSQAVQTGPKGQYVYVIKPDLSAELREIVVDRTEGTETVIAKGLAAGERVVTTGQLRLVPGIKVNPGAGQSAS
jgi:multidrug efflux system membrane fusion protein